VIERHRIAGFTLIEVMVALLIGGMAVAGAAALLSSLGDRAEAVARAGAHVDADANAERLLKSVVANLEASPDTTPSFGGDAQSANFRAWCDTPGGWLDHCTVRLSFQRHGDETVLRLELGGAYSTAVDVRRRFRTGRLCYLVEIDRRPVWVDSWSRRVMPTALAVIIDADTLLLPVWGGG